MAGINVIGGYEKVTTTWEVKGTYCEKCWEHDPPKTWPAPLDIKLLIKRAVRDKIFRTCNLWFETSQLPSVPINANRKSWTPVNWCIANHYEPARAFCGAGCGAVGKTQNIKSTYDRFNIPAPCKDLGSNKPYAQKTVCNAKPKLLGSGGKRPVTVTYEFWYGVNILTGACRGKVISESTTFTRTFDYNTIVKLYGKGIIDYYSKKHCCKGSQVIKC